MIFGAGVWLKGASLLKPGFCGLFGELIIISTSVWIGAGLWSAEPTAPEASGIVLTVTLLLPTSVASGLRPFDIDDVVPS